MLAEGLEKQLEYVIERVRLALKQKPPDTNRAIRVIESWAFDLKNQVGEETPIELLGLPWRLCERLYDAGIWSIEQLLVTDEADLRRIPQVGTRWIRIINDHLHAVGLKKRV